MNSCEREILIKRRAITAMNAMNACLPPASDVTAVTSGMIAECNSVNSLFSVAIQQIQRAICWLYSYVAAFVIENSPYSPYISNVIYLAYRSDELPGNGSEFYPANANTQAKHDAIYAAAPPNTRFVYLPSTLPYITRGPAFGYGWKENWHVDGLDPFLVTVKLEDGLVQVGETRYHFGNGGTVQVNYGSVKNITLDSNLDAQPCVIATGNGNVGGCGFIAKHGKIVNVRLIGAYALPGEGFPMTVISQNGNTLLSPATGTIDNCYFEDARGNLTMISVIDQSGGFSPPYASQFSIARITNNELVNSPTCIGFGAGGWISALISGNRLHNVGTFMVQDTHKGHNVTIRDNIAIDISSYGILANGSNEGQYKNYSILNNTFRVKVGQAVFVQHIAVRAPDMLEFRCEGNVFDSGTEIIPMYGYYLSNTHVGFAPTGNVTTLNGATLAGVNSLTVASGLNLMAGDYLLISPGTTIADFVLITPAYVMGSTTVPTFDPIRNPHPNGAAVQILHSTYAGNYKGNLASNNLVLDTESYLLGCGISGNKNKNGRPIYDTVQNAVPLDESWVERVQGQSGSQVRIPIGVLTLFTGIALRIRIVAVGNNYDGRIGEYEFTWRDASEYTLRRASGVVTDSPFKFEIDEISPNVHALWVSLNAVAVNDMFMRMRVVGRPIMPVTVPYGTGVVTALVIT